MDAPAHLTCPLCAYEFEQAHGSCPDGCPFSQRCNLARCPACAYEFPGPSRTLSLLGRLLGRGGAAPAAPSPHP